MRSAFRSGGGGGDPQAALRELLAREAPLLDATALEALANDLASDLLGMGPIERLLGDESVTDIFIDGPGEVLVERRGCLERTGIQLDGGQILRTIERLVTPLGLRADRAHPIVDARTEDGTRVAVILDPVAPQGPLVALRRHHMATLDLEAFCTQAVADELRHSVRRGDNIVVFGATGAGKTTLVNALSGLIPAELRVVVIEDTSELDPVGPTVVRLEGRPESAEGAGGISMGDLVRAAMRLRPDRLIVGEVRGAEAADMIWALSTGHRGSMSTVHASSAVDAVARLEVMVVVGLGGSVPLHAASAQVRNAVDRLVGVERRVDGSRAVTSMHRFAGERLAAVEQDR